MSCFNEKIFQLKLTSSYGKGVTFNWFSPKFHRKYFKKIDGGAEKCRKYLRKTERLHLKEQSMRTGHMNLRPQSFLFSGARPKFLYRDRSESKSLTQH